MRISVVFELLLIFVLLAFAASRSVERKGVRKRGIQQRKKNERQENPINKYCTCSDTLCNCCRDFQLPLVNLNGPGCASLMYLLGDRMAVSLSFGDRVITNQTLSGRKPKPVCMPLPGRISKFCGRVYNIGRDKEDFRACLGLELHSKKTVEAAVRVSCFRFGPRGLSAEGADPLPLATEQDEDDPEDDDDDEDDDYGIGDDDDEEEDEDEEEDDDEAESEAAENDVDDTADYGGFSILSEDILGGLFGGSSGNKKPPKKKAAAAIATTSTTTTTTTTTTRRPRPTRPSRRPTTTRTTTTRRPTTIRTRRPPRPWRRRTTTTTTLAPDVDQDVTQPPIQSNNDALSLPTPGLIHIPGTVPNIDNIGSNIIAHGTETSDEHGFQPVQLVSPTSKTQTAFVKPPPQSVTPVEDFGIQSSLADITGQLSASPITTIITSPKPIQESSVVQVTEKLDNFEKVDTLQQAVTSSMAMDEVTKTPLRSDHNVVKKPADEEKDEGGIEIVESFMDDDDEINMKQSVESASSESSQDVSSDEASASEITSESNSREKRVKKNKKKNEESDLDLGLSLLSESLGFGGGGKRKKDKKPNNKVEQLTTNTDLKKNDEYDDILGLGSLSETLGFGTSNKNKNKDKRKRENKMMKYDWEQYV